MNKPTTTPTHPAQADRLEVGVVECIALRRDGSLIGRQTYSERGGSTMPLAHWAGYHMGCLGTLAPKGTIIICRAQDSCGEDLIHEATFIVRAGRKVEKLSGTQIASRPVVQAMEGTGGRILVANGTYQTPDQDPPIRRHFRPGDPVNVAIYPPGKSCDAFPGCPVFDTAWAVVLWYPGIREELDLACDRTHALRVAATYTGQTIIDGELS
jgi:hypothetical protein